jgi:hypothetical protein
MSRAKSAPVLFTGLAAALLPPAMAVLLLLLVQPSHADFRACSMNIPSASNCIPGAYACAAAETYTQVPNPIFQKPNPGLTWSSVPGASGYTVVMEDATEVETGKPLSIVHWIMQNISSSGVSNFLWLHLILPHGFGNKLA